MTTKKSTKKLNICQRCGCYHDYDLSYCPFCEKNMHLEISRIGKTFLNCKCIVFYKGIDNPSPRFFFNSWLRQMIKRYKHDNKQQ